MKEIQAAFISIIIPTYNRTKMLGITIESFINQKYPIDKFEIIISDNNSNDNTKDVVTEWQAKSKVPIRYIFEKRQGVHYARNTAAKQASGEILYFTDDDMIADKNLLSELVKVFNKDERIGIATGRVLPKWEVSPPSWIVKHCYNGLLSLNDQGEGTKTEDYDLGVWSCHQAVKRDLFFKSGGFNPENTAGEWIGDGETGLNIKLKELGCKFAYVGSSIIYHMIPSSRMTQKYLNKRLANQGNCDSYTYYRMYCPNKFNLCIRILGHVKNLLKYIICFCFKFIVLNDHWRVSRARVNYYLNRIKYDNRLIKDKLWRDIVLKVDWLNE